MIDSPPKLANLRRNPHMSPKGERISALGDNNSWEYVGIWIMCRNLSCFDVFSEDRVRGQNLMFKHSWCMKPTDTVETAYKVAICPRGYLLYMRIYLITDLKLL